MSQAPCPKRDRGEINSKHRRGCLRTKWQKGELRFDLRLHCREASWIAGIDARWMPEAARAVPRPPIGVGGDVENDVVRSGRVSAHTPRPREVVEAELVSHPPGNKVVCAGGIAADAQPADDAPLRVVQCQSAPEHVDPSNLVPHHRIIRRPVIAGRSLVGHASIHRIAVLQPIEAPARLDRRVQVAVERAKPWGCPEPLLDELLSRLKALAVLAFCAEITRLPGH